MEQKTVTMVSPKNKKFKSKKKNLNLNKKDQVNVLIYSYQINKLKSFNQGILKNVTSYVKATDRFDKPLISFKQRILLKPFTELTIGVLISSSPLFFCQQSCLF